MPFLREVFRKRWNDLLADQMNAMSRFASAVRRAQFDALGARIVQARALLNDIRRGAGEDETVENVIRNKPRSHTMFFSVDMGLNARHQVWGDCQCWIQLGYDWQIQRDCSPRYPAGGFAIFIDDRDRADYDVYRA